MLLTLTVLLLSYCIWQSSLLYHSSASSDPLSISTTDFLKNMAIFVTKASEVLVDYARTCINQPNNLTQPRWWAACTVSMVCSLGLFLSWSSGWIIRAMDWTVSHWRYTFESLAFTNWWLHDVPIFDEGRKKAVHYCGGWSNNERLGELT